jgi:hypothetical protein
LVCKGKIEKENFRAPARARAGFLNFADRDEDRHDSPLLTPALAQVRGKEDFKPRLKGIGGK